MQGYHRDTAPAKKSKKTAALDVFAMPTVYNCRHNHYSILEISRTAPIETSRCFFYCTQPPWKSPRLSSTICAALLQATNSGWNVSPHHPQWPGLEARLFLFRTKHDGATPHPLKQLQGEVLPIWQPMLHPPTAWNTPPPQNNHHPTFFSRSSCISMK